MSGEQWPPAVDESTEWRSQRVRTDDDRLWTEWRSVKVRRVWLWGRRVWIDDQGRVFCDCCWQMVSTEILGTPGNGHHASPWPALPYGAIRSTCTISDPDERTAGDPRSIARIEF